MKVYVVIDCTLIDVAMVHSVHQSREGAEAEARKRDDVHREAYGKSLDARLARASGLHAEYLKAALAALPEGKWYVIEEMDLRP